MKDNIEHDIHIGDQVFCLSGKNKNQVMQVQGFRVIHDYFGDTDAVNLSSKDWLMALNVISLNALGVQVNGDREVTAGPCDGIGNQLHVGDKVLYLHPMEMYTEIGMIKKMSPKSCLLQIEPNRFGQTEYRKKYEEIVSLTAIGKNDLVIEHHPFDD